jgi:hypothetical protein
MGLAPVPSAAPASAPAAAEPRPGEAIAVPAGGCLTAPTDGAASPLLSLPPDGAVVRAGGAPIGEIKLARFATREFPILIEGLGAGAAGELAIPRDRSAAPWRIELETAAPAVVCGRTEAGA